MRVFVDFYDFLRFLSILCDFLRFFEIFGFIFLVFKLKGVVGKNLVFILFRILENRRGGYMILRFIYNYFEKS